MKHPLIIGAGGVASYLLPVLLKTFKPTHVTIVDKDILEERNLDRQMFDAKDIGKSKAAALYELHLPAWTSYPHSTGDSFEIIQDWFTDTTDIPSTVDAIICCADNHAARYCAIKAAQRLGIYAYIGGNEYLDSQAFVYHIDWQGTNRDCLVRYPNIKWEEAGSPVNCTGDAQISDPQLAVANLNCASKLLHLCWIYERWVPENTAGMLPSERDKLVLNLPCELFTSLTENSSIHE